MFSTKTICTVCFVSLMSLYCGDSSDASDPYHVVKHGKHIKHGGSSYYAPAPYGGVYSNYGYDHGSFQSSQQYSQQYAPQVSAPAVNMSQPAPPPGTIGQTFILPSRPVPVEKHPRVGMIDVRISDAKDVVVHDMNPMRTEATIDGFRDAEDPNIWHFETKPLYPGLDQIYRIQAKVKNPDGTEKKVERYVRLIMGRVVEIKIES